MEYWSDEVTRRLILQHSSIPTVIPTDQRRKVRYEPGIERKRKAYCAAATP
jgi:hypothetical protein